MPSIAVRGRVTESGRISLPAEMRKALGVEKGGTVTLRLEDGVVHIHTPEHSARRAQTLYRDFLNGRPGMSVDEFLNWRKQDAAD